MTTLLRIGIAGLLLLAPRIQAQPSSPSQYAGLLERYRAGDDSATRVLASLDDKDVQPIPDSLLAVAMVAHTDAAIAAMETADFVRSRQHMLRAQSYAEKMQAKNRADPLVRQWWPVAIGYMHGERNYVGAVKMIERARALNGDTPELLLAAGVTYELTATAVAGREFGMPMVGTLQQAENAYKSALAADPALVEARLRLARVRTLRGDGAAAARMLAELQTPDDPLFSYLARLFEGDALERQGAIEEARRRYQAAIDLLPRAQSAQIALAYAGRSSGSRKEAADRIRTILVADAADGADPWFWYRAGLASRVELTLPGLRKLVRQ
jgi:tetratricopeptide (TPR) repeat protein